MSTRHYSQTTIGLTRIVMCVDQEGPEPVLLVTEFDPSDRVLKQVRYEHEHGRLANALFTGFGLDGSVKEQWILLYDDNGNVANSFGFDEQGRPLEDLLQSAQAS
jgi:hypothetical protein